MYCCYHILNATATPLGKGGNLVLFINEQCPGLFLHGQLPEPRSQDGKDEADR